ncbi:MAG: SDR family oxidoreductase [Xanthomonadales bacterium]|jgi:NAD(P)-dependent dehydrogenase (short-subunit alcohol dehydrogenase family)|nr:SDR family oxidoreductase [Xanthomonadales bacterium]
MRFQDRRTLITGGSDGIGAELALQLAREGARLHLVGRRRDALAQVAATAGRGTSFSIADLADPAQNRRALDEGLAALGGLDLLVLNAGISGHALLEQVTDLDWYEQMLRVNVLAGIWMTHAALPVLKASHGQIVAISSLAGLTGVPGRTAYCASKFGQTGFFEALRVELAPAGIAVTTIYPGVVATRIRERGYGPDGKSLGYSSLDDSDAMPVAECVRQMLPAIAARRRELVMTAKGRLARWLKLIAPGLVDQLARKALSKEAPGR